MAKSSKPSMPSKTQVAKEDRHYRAEGMVRDAMQNTPKFKAAVKACERDLSKVDANVKGMMAKKGK